MNGQETETVGTQPRTGFSGGYHAIPLLARRDVKPTHPHGRPGVPVTGHAGAGGRPVRIRYEALNSVAQEHHFQLERGHHRAVRHTPARDPEKLGRGACRAFIKQTGRARDQLSELGELTPPARFQPGQHNHPPSKRYKIAPPTQCRSSIRNRRARPQPPARARDFEERAHGAGNPAPQGPCLAQT